MVAVAVAMVAVVVVGAAAVMGWWWWWILVHVVIIHTQIESELSFNHLSTEALKILSYIKYGYQINLIQFYLIYLILSAECGELSFQNGFGEKEVMGLGWFV